MLGSILAVMQVVVWLSPPSRAKNWLLRRFGHTVDRHSRIGINLVIGCDRFIVGAHTVISSFNTFRTLRQVELGSGVQIGSWNWFSAHPLYREYSPENGLLEIGAGTFVTSRHYFDCSGTIVIGPSSAIAGQRSTLQTHELDLVQDRETVGSIRVGDHSFVSTGCILLRDSVLPPRSMLAAGSTLTKNTDSAQPGGLWAGSPARFVKPLRGTWFEGDRTIVQER